MSEEDTREAKILKDGVALRKGGSVEDALNKFEEALKLNPRSAAAYREKALTLQMMGRKDQALREYKNALKIDPSYRMREVAVDKRKEKIATSLKVRDIMTKSITSVPLGATVKDAVESMLKENLSSVAVRIENDIIGIVTERDLIKDYHHISGKDYAKIPIKDFISYPLITISADMSLEDASTQMAMQGIRHFIVSDGDEIVGMVSFRDIFCMLYY